MAADASGLTPGLPHLGIVHGSTKYYGKSFENCILRIRHIQTLTDEFGRRN